MKTSHAGVAGLSLMFLVGGLLGQPALAKYDGFEPSTTPVNRVPGPTDTPLTEFAVPLSPQGVRTVQGLAAMAQSQGRSALSSEVDGVRHSLNIYRTGNGLVASYRFSRARPEELEGYGPGERTFQVDVNVKTTGSHVIPLETALEIVPARAGVIKRLPTGKAVRMLHEEVQFWTGFFDNAKRAQDFLDHDERPLPSKPFKK